MANNVEAEEVMKCKDERERVNPKWQENETKKERGNADSSRLFMRNYFIWDSVVPAQIAFCFDYHSSVKSMRESGDLETE